MQKSKYQVVFENDDFVALNKPAGMLSIPDRKQSEPSLKDMLLAKYGAIFTVHRLDRDTSGLIVFAKTAEAHKDLCRVFEERTAQKKYAGVVIGKPEPAERLIDAPLGEHELRKGFVVVDRKGKPSQTEYKILEAHAAFSLLSFNLLTGRTHQIRVHCKHIGHPLACDELYGDGKPVMLSQVKKKYKLSKHDDEERPVIGRLALHSHTLSFTDAKGVSHYFEAPMPKEFTALMNQLKKLSA